MTSSFYSRPLGFTPQTAPSREKQHRQRIADLKESGQKEISQLKQRTSEFNSMVVQSNKLQDLKDEREVKRLTALSNQLNTFVQDGLVKYMQRQEQKHKIQQAEEIIALAGTGELDRFTQINDEQAKAVEELNIQYTDAKNQVLSAFELQNAKLSATERYKILNARGLNANQVQKNALYSQVFSQDAAKFKPWAARIIAGGVEGAPDHYVQLNNGQFFNVTKDYKSAPANVQDEVYSKLATQFITAHDRITVDQSGRSTSEVDKSIINKHLRIPIAKDIIAMRRQRLQDAEEAVANTEKLAIRETLRVALDNNNTEAVVKIISEESKNTVIWQGKNANTRRKTYLSNTLKDLISRDNIDEDQVNALLQQKINIHGAGSQTIEAFLGETADEIVSKAENLRIDRASRKRRLAKANYTEQMRNELNNTLKQRIEAAGDPDALNAINAQHKLNQERIRAASPHYQTLSPAEQARDKSFYSLPVRQKNRSESERIFEQAIKGRSQISLDEFFRIGGDTFDINYANELVKSGRVTENVFAGLDNVNSPGSKAVERALPEIKTTLETAFGQHLSDEIANPQIQKILNDVPRLATIMAKNLQAVDSSFAGNDEAALREALGDIVKRIKADNPSQFDEAASLSGYTAANYQHKGNLLGTGGFEVRGSNGIAAYSDENAGPSIGQKILNLLGFKRNVEDGISKDPSKDLITDSTNIFPGFTRQDDVGFDLDTHDPHNIIPSRQIQVLSKADPLKRHWTQIYNMQARKIGKEPIDWKTAYPQAYQDSLIHYASSEEEKDLARQGDVASIDRLTQLRENNKELPPNYRVSVMGMVVARDQVIPEIHFNKNLIHGAKLESRTYAEFLNNNEDQVKASKWLTQRLLSIASKDTDSAAEMAMRTFIG